MKYKIHWPLIKTLFTYGLAWLVLVCLNLVWFKPTVPKEKFWNQYFGLNYFICFPQSKDVSAYLTCQQKFHR